MPTNLDNMPNADRPEFRAGGIGADGAITAADNLVGFGESENDAENRAAAQAAGVIDAAYINYDVALDAYAARADVESLGRKNTRNAPADFGDASFMRTTSGNVGTGSAK